MRNWPKGDGIVSSLTLAQKLNLLFVFILGTVLATGSWMLKKAETQAQSIEAGRQEIQAEQERLLNQAHQKTAETMKSIMDASHQTTEEHLDLIKSHGAVREKFKEGFMKGL